MIDVTKHIKISAPFVFMAALSFVFYYPAVFYITYLVMLLHETAHLTAALCIGLRVDYIALRAAGVNLRLKNKMVPSAAEEVILYISGPLVNALLSLLSLVLYAKYQQYVFRLMYISNLMLFIINMLPAMPLDGGFIVRRLLCLVLPFEKAERICVTLSIIISGALLMLGVYVMLNNKHNYSVLMLSLLLLGHVFAERSKYEADLVTDSARRYVSGEM